MNRLLVVTVVSMMLATSAFAGGFGLGWEDGVSAKFPAGPVTIQGVLGFMSGSPDDNNFRGLPDGTAFSLAGYVAYPFITVDQAKFNFFGGLGFQSVPDADVDFGFRFGVEPVAMVTKHVGVGGKLGIEFMSYGDVDNADKSGGSTFGFWGITSVHWFF